MPTITMTNEDTRSIEPSRRPRMTHRTTSSSKIPRNKPAEDDVDSRRAWETKLKQAMSLNEAILKFLATVVKQDKIPLTSGLIITESVKSLGSFVISENNDEAEENTSSASWDRARRQLDETFRNILTWRQTFKDDDIPFDDQRMHVEDIERVYNCLLAMAHHLIHLIDLDSPEWNSESKDDAPNMKLKVLWDFELEVETIAKQIPTSNASDCKFCNPVLETDESADKAATTTVEEIDYFSRLTMLVAKLMEESEPLQLMFRRRDWVRQAGECRDPDKETEAQLPHKRPKSKN